MLASPRMAKLGPESEQKQNPAAFAVFPQILQQFAGIGVCPLQVLDNEEQRALYGHAICDFPHDRKNMPANLPGAHGGRGVGFFRAHREKPRKKRDGFRPRGGERGPVFFQALQPGAGFPVAQEVQRATKEVSDRKK